MLIFLTFGQIHPKVVKEQAEKESTCETAIEENQRHTIFYRTDVFNRPDLGPGFKSVGDWC